RTTHRANPAFADRMPGLPERYSMKALHVDGAEADQRVYVPAEGAVTESRVFPVMPVTDKGEAPIAFAKVGEGYLGYVGDVNNETGTQRVILAMIG
ncbi:hypothetical protein DFJ74DRAFT_597421, partial [Hyaloraphidium curvatum]